MAKKKKKKKNKLEKVGDYFSSNPVCSCIETKSKIYFVGESPKEIKKHFKKKEACLTVRIFKEFDYGFHSGYDTKEINIPLKKVENFYKFEAEDW